MRITKLVILMIIMSSLVFPQTKLDDIQTFTLKNGMKFIVIEDHSIPNANLYIFFKVGSRNEYPGITGLSHFFEHMMFNGAKQYGPGMFDRVMEANGGANNAYTNENVTVYTDWFPADSIEVMFELEADRIGNLALDDKMVESERGVVLSERITTLENSHVNFLEEQMKGVAFMAHPYRWPIIGYESDIRNWKKTDLQRYFDTYYAPNNAVAIIAGAVSVPQVKSLAEKYFGPIPRRPEPRPIHTVEPEQLGEKRLAVKRAVSTPNLMIAYHVPQANSEDYYALDLLNGILSEGRSSRLYKALIDEKQLAVNLFTFFQKGFDPTLLYIYAVAGRGVDENKLEQAIYTEIDTIVKDGVSAKELQKAQNRKLMEFYRDIETINRRANSIGEYEVFFGGYEKLFSAPDKYKAVTIDDIKRVAAHYFKKSNRTVGILKNSEEA